MAGNYPAHDIVIDDNTMNPESGHDDDFAPGGTQHSRQFHSKQYFRWDLVHFLTQAQFDSLAADYDANPRTTRTFIWPPEADQSPEITYTVKYQARPRQVRKTGVDQWMVVVPLRGYKD